MVELFHDLTATRRLPMPDPATTPTRSDTPTGLALEVAFDDGRLTSDGGLPWLAKTGVGLGLCESIAEQVPE